MSKYLDMWSEINEMSINDIQAWIEELDPAKGKFVDFNGIKVIDIDALEALKNARDSRDRRAVRHNVFDQTHPFVD